MSGAPQVLVCDRDGKLGARFRRVFESVTARVVKNGCRGPRHERLRRALRRNPPPGAPRPRPDRRRRVIARRVKASPASSAGAALARDRVGSSRRCATRRSATASQHRPSAVGLGTPRAAGKVHDGRPRSDGDQVDAASLAKAGPRQRHPVPLAASPQLEGTVCRRPRLGGVLSFYARKSA